MKRMFGNNKWGQVHKQTIGAYANARVPDWEFLTMIHLNCYIFTRVVSGNRRYQMSKRKNTLPNDYDRGHSSISRAIAAWQFNKHGEVMPK